MVDVGTGTCGIRRRKTAKERREQKQRSWARSAQQLLAGCLSIHGHRGGALSRVELLMVDSLRMLGSAPAPEKIPIPSIAVACRVVDVQDIDHVGSETIVEEEGPRTSSPWATM